MMFGAKWCTLGFMSDDFHLIGSFGRLKNPSAISAQFYKISKRQSQGLSIWKLRANKKLIKFVLVFHKHKHYTSHQYRALFTRLMRRLREPLPQSQGYCCVICTRQRWVFSNGLSRRRNKCKKMNKMCSCRRSNFRSAWIVPRRINLCHVCDENYLTRCNYKNTLKRLQLANNKHDFGNSVGNLANIAIISGIPGVDRWMCSVNVKHVDCLYSLVITHIERRVQRAMPGNKRYWLSGSVLLTVGFITITTRRWNSSHVQTGRFTWCLVFDNSTVECHIIN